VAVDGSEACISLTPSKAFCARDGAVTGVAVSGLGLSSRFAAAFGLTVLSGFASNLAASMGLVARLVEITKVLKRFPWMVDAIKQRQVGILHPYTVEVYVAVDGSEACISLTPSKAFCARDGAVKEVKLELEFKRYETYEDKTREVYRPKGLLAFATAAGEYVRLL
jgi:hypothetical protein